MFCLFALFALLLLYIKMKGYTCALTKVALSFELVTVASRLLAEKDTRQAYFYHFYFVAVLQILAHTGYK